MVSNSPAPSPGANSSCQSFSADLPAFPILGEVHLGEGGLTKRELFAAMAMMGYCAHRHAYSHAIALQAVRQADALLTALDAPYHEIHEDPDDA